MESENGEVALLVHAGKNGVCNKKGVVIIQGRGIHLGRLMGSQHLVMVIGRVTETFTVGGYH